MKISLPIPAFRNAVLRASGVINNSSTLPIIGNLLLEAQGDQLRVTATNLDQFLQLSLPCTVAKPGSITLPAARLPAIAKAMVGDELTLAADDKLWATLKAGSNSYRLAGLPHEEFPALPEFDCAKEWTMPQDDLRRAFSRVQFAQSVDSTRYVLNGVLLEVIKGVATFAATDGRRMAIVERPLAAPDCREIIPSECVRQLLRILSDKGEAHLRLSHEWIGVEAGGTTLFSKFVAESYPNYRQPIPNPDRFTGGTALPREETINLLRRVMAVGASDKTPSMRATFGENNLSLLARNGETAESVGEMPLKCKDKLTVAFAPAFLDQALSALDEDEVRLSWIGDLDPLVLRAGDFTGVIMPMRVAY